MYKICKYCLSKVRLGVLKVSLCIYRVLAFFDAIWLFQGFILAFFAYEYQAALSQPTTITIFIRFLASLDCKLNLNILPRTSTFRLFVNSG